MRITLSESNDESEGETTNKVMAFPEKYESDSSDEEMTIEELVETFRLLHTKWKEACTIFESQNKTIGVLNEEK